MRTARFLATMAAPALSLTLLAVPSTAAPHDHPGAASRSAERAPAAASSAAGDNVVVEPHGDGWTITWSRPGKHRVFASQRPKNPSRSGELVGSSSWGSVHVKGLDPARRWYFEVAPAAQVKKAKKARKDVRGVIAAARHLGLDSSTNTRDLGGFRTADGRSVRWGMLLRSDAIVTPSTRDAQILKGMRLRHAVDFRAETEVAKDGANSFAPSVKQVAMPLLDDSTTALSDAIQAVIRNGDPAVAEELLGNGKAEEIAATGPAKMIRRSAVRQAFGRLLTIMSKDGGVPLIFNCTAGKDRTGVFAAIALRVLGVPEKPLLADYELSNKYRAASNQRTYAYLQGVGVDPALLKPLMEQSGANLANMFRAIEQDYGSFDRFVRSGLGLDAKTVKRLRANLLD